MIIDQRFIALDEGCLKRRHPVFVERHLDPLKATLCSPMSFQMNLTKDYVGFNLTVTILELENQNSTNSSSTASATSLAPSPPPEIPTDGMVYLSLDPDCNNITYAPQVMTMVCFFSL